MTTPPYVADFDHHSEGFALDPVSHYRELRERCPVAWSDHYDGFWIPTRYEDIVRIARDDATFSSARSPGEGDTSFLIPRRPSPPQLPIELDPPESYRFRRLLNPVLSPPAVGRMAPMIAEITTECIDRFIERGSCDLVYDLANPIPATVTLRWLGFPTDEWERFALPVHDIFVAPPGSDRLARGQQGLAWIQTQIAELIGQRRREPIDDVVSILIGSTPDGPPLSDEEILSMVFLVLLGGVDTTTSLLSQTLVYLDGREEDRRRLVQDPQLMGWATEEFLRVFAPSQAMARTVTTQVEIDDALLRAGDRVLLPWVAANFDPAVFDDPEKVVFERAPNRHASFGVGLHRCVGAHLARGMFVEMLRQVLARLPDYSVVRDQLRPYPSKGNQTGWDSVPARFTPGRHSGVGIAPMTAGERLQ
jgi:cytochrome P450